LILVNLFVKLVKNIYVAFIEKHLTGSKLEFDKLLQTEIVAVPNQNRCYDFKLVAEIST